MGQPTEHYPLAVTLKLAGRDEEGQRDEISSLLILLGPRQPIEEILDKAAADPANGPRGKARR